MHNYFSCLWNTDNTFHCLILATEVLIRSFSHDPVHFVLWISNFHSSCLYYSFIFILKISASLNSVQFLYYFFLQLSLAKSLPKLSSNFSSPGDKLIFVFWRSSAIKADFLGPYGWLWVLITFQASEAQQWWQKAQQWVQWAVSSYVHVVPFLKNFCPRTTQHFSGEKCHLGAHSTQLVINPKESWDGTGAGALSTLLLL